MWFDLLPALREGRICITNIHGMQPLEVIEQRLGEKFPDSTSWSKWFAWFCHGF
ncbi:zonular occludens toxin domain-containing protein [Vibrio alginolyticus]|uniref:zonular occludens toxin domain-containing protein n=1 Tax=Vibrio alginolyticus TaxID=663 RepID=UPI001C01D49D